MNKEFKQPNEEDKTYIMGVLGADRVRWDSESIQAAASDMTEDLVFLPALVVFPETTQEVSQIVKHCHTQNIALS